MSSEWRHVRLGDITAWSSGGTPAKSNPLYWNGDIPWISAKNMPDGWVQDSDIRITPEGLAAGSSIAPSNSVLVLVRGSGLFSRRYICRVKRPVAFNQDIKCIQANEEILPEFLYYLLKGNDNQLIAMLESTGIGAGKFDTKRLQSLKVELPPLSAQKDIVDTLSCLDDKIELNNLMNRTLEETAQAIFKSWFLGFEESKPFTDIVQVIGGGTPKTGIANYWGGEIPFFTPKDALNTYVLSTEKTLTKLGIENCSSRLYPINTVFITARGTVGKLSLAGCPMAMNQSCYALVGKEGYGQYFVYHLAQTVMENLKHKASGAIFDAIVTRDFESERVAVPSDEEVRSFENRITPIYKAILNNSIESAHLSVLRDSLLPRLMSGEIQVPVRK
jgi:type I restriction enzyme S subunit